MPQRSGTFFVKGEKIVLRKDSTWMADGVEITHEQTRELFYRSIHWDDSEKKFCLKIGYETMFIEVEDTPFFVTSVSDGPAPAATLTNGTTEPIRASRLTYSDGALYLKTADGQRARFLSAPYYALLRSLQEDDKHYFLTIAGERANLSPKDPASPARRPGGPKRP